MRGRHSPAGNDAGFGGPILTIDRTIFEMWLGRCEPTEALYPANNYRTTLGGQLFPMSSSEQGIQSDITEQWLTVQVNLRKV